MRHKQSGYIKKVHWRKSDKTRGKFIEKILDRILKINSSKNAFLIKFKFSKKSKI